MSEHETPSAQVADSPTASDQQGPQPTWKVVRERVLPGYLRMLSILAAAALAWLALEVFWPQAKAERVEVVAASGTDQAEPDPTGQQPVISFVDTLFMRKLFIPEVAIESKDNSAQVTQLLARLKLIAVSEQNGQLIAWVRILGSAPRGNQRGGRNVRMSPSQSSANQQTKKVKKGDKLIDFTVEEVKERSLILSLPDFSAELSF